MSINLIRGRPGGGKSYEAVAFHVLPALKNGRKVITNLPLKTEHFIAVFGEEYIDELLVILEPTPEQPIRFKTIDDYADPWRHAESGTGPLYIIDECHFPLRKGQTIQEVEEWFSMHRHELADVLLMTQSHRKMDQNIKDMVQLCYLVSKVPGRETHYYRKVIDGVVGSALNTDTREYDATYFPFYRSHTKSDNAGSESTAVDVKPLHKHPVFIALYISIAVFIGALVWGVSQFMADDPEPVEPVNVSRSPASSNFSSLESQFQTTGSDSTVPVKSSVSPADGPQLAPVVEPEPEPPKHPYSRFTMTIAGHITKADREIYVVVMAQNGQSAFQLSSDTMMTQGYDIEGRGECLFEVTYDEFHEYITCGFITQSTPVPSPVSG